MERNPNSATCRSSHNHRWQRLCLFVAVVLLFASQSVQAQCINAAQFGSAPAPAQGNTTTITTCAFYSEYSTVTGLVGTNSYLAISAAGTTLTGPSNYLTVTDELNNVIIHGQSPVQFTGVSGNIRIHASLSVSDCAGGSGCVTNGITTLLPPGPPQCATSVVPANFSSQIGLSQQLSWTSLSNPANTGYDIYFGTTFPPPLVAANYPTTTYNPGALLCNTVYYWQVNPISPWAGGTTTTCPVQFFQTLSQPVCPTSFTPLNFTINAPLSQAIAWGAVTGVSGYNVYFGTTTNPPFVANTSLTSWTPPSNLLCATTYYWRIEPINCSGPQTTCVENQFTTVGVLPGCSSASSPSNSLATIVSPLSTITWTAATNAVAYNLYVDVVNPPVTQVLTNWTGTTYTPPTPLPCNDTIYWRVEPINCVGTNTTCPVFVFRTFNAVPSVCPTLGNPANLATNIAWQPTLTWSASTNAQSYDVYLGVNPTPVFVANTTNLFYTPPVPLSGGTTYAWRIVPVNCNGPATTCTTNRTFTTAVANTAGLLNYDVTMGPATYTPIVGTTPLTFTSTSLLSAITNTVSLAGFNFTYNGVAVTGFKASLEGYLTFNTAITTSTGTNQLGASTVQPTINTALAPFWDDLTAPTLPVPATATQSQQEALQYLITGAPGSQVLTVQWKNMSHASGTSTGQTRFNFQIKCYEGSNNIEFVYGDMEGFSGTGNFGCTYSLGMNAATQTVTTSGGPSAGQVIAQQREWEKAFSYTNCSVSSSGANGLTRVPDCNTSILFTPGAYSGDGPVIGAPSNDNAAGAIALTRQPQPCTAYCGTYYTSRFATQSPQAACLGMPDDDVWFTFTVPNPLPPLVTGTRISVGGYNNYDPVVQVLDNTFASVACVNATSAGFTELLNLTSLTLGATYYLRVYHNAAGSGTTLTPGGAITAGQFLVCVSDLVPPPVNDDCLGAITLTSNDTCFSIASPNMLTVTASGLTSCNGTPDDDVWYTFTPLTSAPNIQVQSGTGFNAVVQIFSSSGACAGLTQVVCQNNTGVGGLESVTTWTNAVPGAPYYARIYHQAVGTSVGGFTICLLETPPPCVTLTAPANGLGILAPTLTWTSGGASTVNYDVLLDTSNPPTTVVATNLFTTSYTPGGLLPNTQYFWKVVPKNGAGANTTCAVRNFTTCDPPAGTISMTENCGAGTVTLTVNLTSLGSAPSVDIVATPGGLFTGGDDYSGPVPASFQLTMPASQWPTVSVINNASSTCMLSFPQQIDCCNGSCLNPKTAATGTNYCPPITCGATPYPPGTTSGGLTKHARWFSFTPPSNGTLQVNSCDAGVQAGGPSGPNIPPGPPYNSDTRGYIFTGSCVTPTQIAFFDDECTTPTFGSFSPVLNVTGGTTYYIEWDNYWSGADFYWNLTYVPCAWGVSTINVTENCGLGNFSYDLNVLTMGSGTSWKLMDNGTPIDTIYAVGTYSFGPYAIGTAHNLTAVDLAVPTCTVTVGTANDCCGSTCATALPAVLGVNQTGPMNCGNGASNAATFVDPGLPPTATHARWFYYSPPSNGVVTVSSCAPTNTTNNDTYVTVHQGSSCGSTALTVFDDDLCFTPAFGSNASFVGTAGQNYFIEWDGRWINSAHGWDLGFVPCPSTPTNDLCVNEVPTANTLSPSGPTLTFTGDVTCSDRDAIGGLFIASVSGWTWESFHLDTCARVAIDFCGSPQYTNNNIGSIYLINSCAATTLIQPVATDFNPVGVGCAPGIERATFDLAPGDYYLPVIWAPAYGIGGAYQVNIDPQPPVSGCSLCSNAPVVSCGAAYSGTTTGFTNTMPATACALAPGQPASTAGTRWYRYDNLGGDTLVNINLCSPAASFNTRVSVFSATSCSNLCCVTFNDNGPNPPCTANGSQTRFIALAGQTYYILVHGNAAGAGTYTMQVICEPEPVPPANDRCLNAQALIPVVDDGSGVFTPADNTNAMPDPNTTCTPLTNVQGVWYSFNSGPSQTMILNIDEAAPYTAAPLGYALYTGCNTGSCANGGSTQVSCANVVTSSANLTVTPFTNYVLNVYNQGGIGVHGTFGVLLEYPANYDAAIDSVIVPGPTVCGTTFNPQVILKNWGQVQLNTATITYQIDGGTPVNYSWFGALNYLQTEVVSITPPVTLSPGIHTFTATVSSPNGQVDEIPSNNAVATFNFDNTGQPVRILMRTDNYGEETGYEIFAANDFAFAAAGGTHPNSGFPINGTAGPWADNTTIIDDICLPQNSNGQYCYIMVIYDSFGDGMCCAYGNGFWSVQTQQGDLLLRDKFDVASTISPVSSIYVGQTFCLPKGPTDVLSSECNIFSNSLYSKVYCQNTGAANYQFSFENPDAGFYRRISVPRNWVQFSEMQTPSLVPGTVYFCRVRADQGSPGYSDDRFGAGCDMAIDPASINGCTQLIDNISLPTHSCGVIKTFGGSDKIWANPIVGATQYRFRFVGLIDPDGAGPNPPAAGTRNIVRTSYICPLNWTTSTLVDGQTYTVTVECFLAGQWRGFCGASCNLTIDNTPVQGGGNNLHVIAQEEGSTVTMWPNPVRDGLVNLVLSEIGDEEQAVTVDVYDGFGKLVRNYEFTSTADLFTTVIDLGDMAAGNYTVNIAIGDKTYTERLNVQ